MNRIAKPNKQTGTADWSFKEPDPYAQRIRLEKKLKNKFAREERKRRKRKYAKNLTKKQLSDRKFFDSREWRELRYKALLEHGKQCQCCGAKPPGVILHVDHVKPRFKFPELELSLGNLQVLCEDCNLGKGAWDETDHRKQSNTNRGRR